MDDQISPEETARRIDKLLKMWPRPRVGFSVVLRNNQVGEVVSVRTARDILKQKTEVQALMMIPSLAAVFGEYWTEVYYEADVFIHGRLQTIDTRDVTDVIASE
jgi:hypothetical protein